MRRMRLKKKQQVEALLEKVKRHPSYGLTKEVVFCDETHISNQPYVCQCWSPVGHPVKLPTPKSRQRMTVFGAMTLSHARVYYRSENKGNGQAFIRFIKQLLKRMPDRLLFLVVDNSNIHLSKRVKAFLAKQPRVVLLQMPTYAPEYNSI